MKTSGLQSLTPVEPHNTDSYIYHFSKQSTTTDRRQIHSRYDPLLVSLRNRMGGVVDTQTVEYRLHLPVNGSLAHEQVLGNAPVPVPFGHQLQHFQLAERQLRP